MATHTMTDDGRTQRTIDFYNKTNLYMGIGRTTDWTSEPTPDEAVSTIQEVEELQAIKKVDTKKFVRQEAGGEIVFNGSTWTEVSETEQTYTASTISFTAPNTIDDSANSFPIFKIGTRIKIAGATNEGYFTVVSSTTATITVEESITNQGEGSPYTIKSNLLSNNINHLFLEALLAYDDGTPDSLPLITYRQVGLLEGPIDDTETPCTGSVYTTLSSTEDFPQGVLHYIDNRTPITRTDSQKEAIQLIIEF